MMEEKTQFDRIFHLGTLIDQQVQWLSYGLEVYVIEVRLCTKFSLFKTVAEDRLLSSPVDTRSSLFRVKIDKTWNWQNNITPSSE
jgi:hypothetical protein